MEKPGFLSKSFDSCAPVLPAVLYSGRKYASYEYPDLLKGQVLLNREKVDSALQTIQ